LRSGLPALLQAEVLQGEVLQGQEVPCEEVLRSGGLRSGVRRGLRRSRSGGSPRSGGCSPGSHSCQLSQLA
jgi:hypothetical protein